MTAARLETVKAIFHDARELLPHQRNAFLADACGVDEQLRREVNELLASDQAMDGFMADAPAALALELFGRLEANPDVGRTIAQYKLIECIGSGGMGSVYLAERADQQFRMQVAVKLIKRGMDTASVLRRFHHERQILASLDHPNIARLLDGGTTDDGRPYFVMEYIKGERIDRYAEERQLSVTDRLELFRQVCGAVSYAHQHLVVHRDLKPSNILVTADGTPKLLDFGIAKIVAEDGSANTLATMTAMPAMTPEYASPEQIDGVPATTLSDVYSLGAVLYELLSGRPPFRLQNRSSKELERISTKHIDKPSAVVARAEDGRRLRGDLDNIVLMAMRKETGRRYRSVEQFSEDIRRHLAGRPVIARPDTLSYRAGKFLQRNRLGVAAAALLLVSLVAGVVATAQQARRARVQEQRARVAQARAERRFNDVRKLANNVLFDYHDAIQALPGATKVRERLVRDALTYLDSLAGEVHDDTSLQRELAAAYERVGDVRGGKAIGSLGDTAGALDSYTKAFRIREALLQTRPNDAVAQRDVAESERKIGDLLLDTAETSDGVEHLRKARAVYLDLTRVQPAKQDLQFELADTCNKLGHALMVRGDEAGALEQFRAALAICEPAAANHPSDAVSRRTLWHAYDGIGDVLFGQRDATGAIEANDKALALGNALLADDAMNADYRRHLVLSYKNGADYRRFSDKPRALDYFRRAIALEEELLAADPANALTRRDLGYTHKRVAEFFANLKDYAQALSHFNQAREIFEKAVADAPGDILSRFRVASCGAGVAGMEARLGRIDDSLEECRKTSALLRDISEDATNSQHRHLRAEACEYLGYAYTALAAVPQLSPSQVRQHWTSARDMFQESLNILDDLRSRGLLNPDSERYTRTIGDEKAKCDAALAR